MEEDASRGFFHLQPTSLNLVVLVMLIRFSLVSLIFLSLGGFTFGQTNPFVELSKELLIAIKQDEPTSSWIDEYKHLDVEHLQKSLDTRQKKLAFWINTYNAFIQITLQKNPTLYQSRNKFFSEPRLMVAGIQMSFDQIEHSIIRNSRHKLSGGYFKRWFEPDWIKRLRNEEIDERIHFALNCGARSCPPIMVYDDKTLDEQLDEIAKHFLLAVTSVESSNVLTTPLISWFRGDFGGLSGAVELMKELEVIPSTWEGKLEFRSYDWTLSLRDFIEL